MYGKINRYWRNLVPIHSLDKLLETGQVQIDFTDDGSLENLKQKLHENHYHILHFSGHGSFNEGQGYLLVEEELSSEKKLISAKHFAEILNVKPEHLPDLVLLSSCQTAQGDNNSDFSGVANQLIQVGIPSVIAMGWSVSDYYATSFASFFYNKLSVQEPIHRAFQNSIDHIKNLEQNNNSNSSNLAFPKQWMIPQLYTNGFCENIIDWNSPSIKLKYKTELWNLRQHHQKYYFVGRRRDRKEIIGDFFNKNPIWLKGQGGIGKSSMAEHLIQRLIAHEPNTVVFEQNETNLGLKNLEVQIISYLENKHQKFTIRVDLDRFSEKTIDRLKHLFQLLKDLCNPVFLFDNLEDFQEKEDDPSFKSNFNDVEEMLFFLHQTKSFHVICTGRYLPPPSIEQLTITKNINQVSFSDFWKKSQQLELFHIKRKLTNSPVSLRNKNASYENVIYLLYKVFGGNFRALEFFDELFKVNEKSTSELILQFQKLNEQSETQQTLQRISEDLVFTKLLSLLNDDDTKTLSLLSNFRRPVIMLALEMQDSCIKFDSPLDTLSNLTLIEKRGTSELQKYYVTPLVKQLLKINNFALANFDDNQAGEYYEYYYKEINKEAFADYEEAFEHYFYAQNKEKVTELGSLLGATYNLASLSQKTFYIANKSINLLGEDADGRLWNILGTTIETSGDSVKAEYYFNKAIEWAEKNNNDTGQIVFSSNKAQIYLKKSRYPEALEIYQKSLNFCDKIGNSKLKPNILNSIGSIYREQGLYALALKSFNEGLTIAKEVKLQLNSYDVLELEEANILNSVAGTHFEQGEYEKAFKIFEENLLFYRKVFFKQGELNSLNGMCVIYQNQEKYEKALQVAQLCLNLSIELQDKRNYGIALSSMGLCFLKLRNYSNALLDFLRK